MAFISHVGHAIQNNTNTSVSSFGFSIGTTVNSMAIVMLGWEAPSSAFS